jgi:hypothetical protein
MRNTLKYIVLLFSIVFLIAECKKGELPADVTQLMLFQYDYKSETQHYGYILDNEGNVYTYNNPEDWNFPDKNLVISQDEASENGNKCVLSGQKIDTDELIKYAKTIEFIALSKVTAPRNVGSDKGTVQYICYQFSENLQVYKGYIIKTEGDVTRENLNFHSKRIASWMREIGEAIPSE